MRADDPHEVPTEIGSSGNSADSATQSSDRQAPVSRRAPPPSARDAEPRLGAPPGHDGSAPGASVEPEISSGSRGRERRRVPRHGARPSDLRCADRGEPARKRGRVGPGDVGSRHGAAPRADEAHIGGGAGSSEIFARGPLLGERWAFAVSDPDVRRSGVSDVSDDGSLRAGPDRGWAPLNAGDAVDLALAEGALAGGRLQVREDLERFAQARASDV